jgi:hypothetical protein
VVPLQARPEASVKASEFRARQREASIRDAAARPWELTTAIEQPDPYDRVLYDSIFERDHPSAAVTGRAERAERKRGSR